MSTARRATVLLASLAAACAMPRGPADRQEDYGPWGERLLVEATAMPAVWLDRDDERPTADPDQFEGFGYGLRAALGDRSRSLGIAYQGFDTATDTNDLQVHALCLDGDVRGLLPDVPDLFWFRAGFALGGAWIDASDDDDLQAEAMAELRLGIEFQPIDRMMISAGIGGVVFGHPGDTEAYGTFLTLGATLVF